MNASLGKGGKLLTAAILRGLFRQMLSTSKTALA